VPVASPPGSAQPAAFDLQVGTSNDAAVPVASITPGVLLGLDGSVQGMTLTRQNGDYDWSPAGGALIYSDSFDATP
jgi:hypothetical protein